MEFAEEMIKQLMKASVISKSINITAVHPWLIKFIQYLIKIYINRVTIKRNFIVNNWETERSAMH